MDWKLLLFEMIDMRSFSNLWYWIALAVVWSQASHWVLGVPYDMVQRARAGGRATEDLDLLAGIYVRRLTHLYRVSGVVMVLLASFVLTVLAVLGFRYGNEFSQAVVLILGPLAVVGALSLRTALRIEAEAAEGEALQKRLSRHRLAVQVIGMISIFVTALWGMMQNFNVSILH